MYSVSEGSSPCSKRQLPVCVLTYINAFHTFLPYLRAILILTSNMLLGLQTGLFSSGCQARIVHACHTFRLFYPSRPDHLNNRWWREQIMNFLIQNSSPISCYRLLLRFQHYSQNSVRKHIL